MQSPVRGQILILKADKAGKERPILVVSPKFLNGGISVRGVPFSSQQLERRKLQETCVYFAQGEFGLDKECVAMTSELSEYRISEFKPGIALGPVSDQRMLMISKAICISLGIDFGLLAATFGS